MKMTRRVFLKTTGTGAAALAFHPAIGFGTGASSRETAPDVAQVFFPTGKVPPECRVAHEWCSPCHPRETFPLAPRLRVTRPLDLLDLEFEWTNVDFCWHRGTPCVVKRRGQQSFLTVWFPPQHLSEQAFTTPQIPLAQIPVQAVWCGRTRLVFSVPAVFETKPVPYDLATMLDWNRLMPSLASNALPPNFPVTARMEPHQPADSETVIELPWGMYLSPDAAESWSHRVNPPHRGGCASSATATRIELWTSELRREKATPDVPQSVRAIWRELRDPKDLPNPKNPLDRLKPLPRQEPTHRQREALVQETSNFDLNFPDGHRYLPKHINVQRLMLSSQGAYANLRVGWNYEELQNLNPAGFPPLNVGEWVQQTVWGRDQYVKVSELGYCLPFGHVVSVETVHEREFVDGGRGKGIKTRDGREVKGPVALVKERTFCVVRQPVIDYAYPADGVFVYGRGTPFKRVEVLSRETPLLARDPVDLDGWMLLEGANEKEIQDADIFRFKIRAWDWNDRVCEFELPLWWVSKPDAETGVHGGKPLSDFSESIYRSKPSRRTARLSRQKVSFAPRGASNSRDLSVETSQIVFYCEFDPRGFPRFWVPQFYPRMEWAEVRLAQMEAFDRSGSPATPRLEYNGDYLARGLGADQQNGNEVFADIKSPSKLDFAADKSGGLCTPSFEVEHLSRVFGPVGRGMAPAAVGRLGVRSVSGGFDPHQFLGDAAQLIGGVDLRDAVEAVDEAFEEIAKVPKLVAQTIAEIQAGAKEIEATVQMVMSLRDTLSGAGNAIVQQFKRSIQDKLTSEFRKQADALRDNALKFLLQEVPAYQEIGAALFQVASAKLKAILNAPAPAAVLDVIKGVLADPGLLAQLREAAHDPSYLETRFKEEFTNRVGAEWQKLAEGQRARLVDEMAEYVASGPGVNTLVNLRVFQSGAQGLQASLSDKATEILKQAYTSIPPMASEAVNEVTTHPEVVREIRLAWRNPEALRQKVKDKCAVLLIGLEPAISARITDDLTAFIANELPALMAIDNRSLVQLRDYVLARMEDARMAKDDLEATKRVFDPNTVLDAVNAEINWMAGTFGALGDFPLPSVQRIATMIAGLADEVRSNPLSALGHLSQALGDIAREIGSVTGASTADVVKGETETLEQIRQRAIQGRDKLASRLEGEIARIKRDTGGFLSRIPVARPGPDVAAEVAEYLGAGEGALRTYLNEAVGGVKPLDQWGQSVQTFADSLTQNGGWLLEQYEGVVSSVGKALASAAAAIAQVQEMVKEVESRIPKELAVDYAWEPRLRSTGSFEARRNGVPATFILSARIRKSLRPERISERPSVRIDGRLRDFQLNLLNSPRFISVAFKEVSFVSVDGGAPVVNVKIDGVTFGEALKFVQELAKALNPDSGFFIELADAGLEAGYRFALPNITAGGFSLVQVSINAAVVLPFDGSPVRVKFSLCERSRPFLLSVGILGGGGFFGITLNPKGVESLEGSFEFGAVVALDIGVAAGVVSVTAGIYFSQSSNGDASLYGFVRAAGALRVIGLITVSLQFYLGLGYEKRDGKTLAVGEAILTVEIEVMFFSVSVDLHYRKEFEGSSDESSASGHERVSGARRLRVLARVAGVRASVPVVGQPEPEPRVYFRLEGYLTHKRNWKNYRAKLFSWNRKMTGLEVKGAL